MNKKLLFSTLVMLFSIGVYAQCPTNISDPDGDGGRYLLTLANIAQCSTAPYNTLGTEVTLNGTANKYVMGTCNYQNGSSGTVIATVTFDAGTPVVLASGSVTLVAGTNTCVFNSSGGVVIPIELMAFNARNTEGGNLLTWTTGAEINNSAFDVERSRDGQSFIKIGTVKAQGIAAKYTFTDAQPFNGTTYYRLKSLDNDQSFAYSHIVSVQIGKAKAGIKIYPTTTTGVLTIENNGQKVDEVTIFNHVGQTVFTAKNTNSLTINHLSAGLYFVQVQAGQEKVVEKVFKQ